MSYLYDRLKEALGGNRLTESKSSVISDWSPNSIRAIFIGRDSIIVVNHLGVFGGCTRKIDMDVNLVLKDVEEINRTNYGKPKLNTLLTKRSFSCLEEIYVDVCYASMPRVIHLVDYVGELVKTNNFRLRYYGYGDFSNPVLRDYLNKAYKEAYSRKDYGYSFAMDSAKPVSLKFHDLENGDWYRRYYLRPQYYKKDRQGGDLDIHFKKIEKGYPEYLNSKLKDSQSAEFFDKFMKIVQKDISNRLYFVKIDSLLSYLGKSDDKVCKLVFSSMKNVLVKDRKVDGLSRKVLEQVLGGNGLIGKYMMGCYENYRVLDKSSGSALKVDNYLEGQDGFILLGKVLDELCLEVTKNMIKNGYKDMVTISLMYNSLNMPNGEFLGKYASKLEGDNKGSYDGYINYLSELVGIDI